MKLQIKLGLEIGDDCPPFIIAEIGSNWATLDDCLASIEKAKEAGADAVKFQLFDYISLYGNHRVEKYSMGQWCVERGRREHDLNPAWLPKLKEKADACGIAFMCSAFSPELIDAVDPYVNIHKLASAEMCHVRMLERLREIGKPVFMSTGAHTLTEIKPAVEILGTTPLVLMYCVAAYPAKEIRVGNISRFRDTFFHLVGYSDHSLDILCVPRLAQREGACVFEKHVQFVDGLFPDTSHSLNFREFTRYCGNLRNGAFINEIGPTDEEKDMRLRHNRRLIVTRDVRSEEILRENSNFGIYRGLKDCEKALSPFDIGRVEGKKAKKALSPGDAICGGDFK